MWRALARPWRTCWCAASPACRSALCSAARSSSPGQPPVAAEKACLSRPGRRWQRRVLYALRGGAHASRRSAQGGPAHCASLGARAEERMGRRREAAKPPRAAAQIEALDPDSYKRPYFAGTHVFPAFPGAAASFISPVCTDVDLLEKGQAEGYNMILRLFTDAEPLPQQPPAAAAAAPAAVANLPV